MAKDAFGNYTTGLDSAGYVGTGGGLGFVGFGHGAPDATTPLWYTLYVDLDTGLVYNNPPGTATGWASILAGLSSVAGVFSSVGDPNGVVTCVGAAVCVGKDGSNNPTGEVWVSSVAGTAWTKIIG